MAEKSSTAAILSQKDDLAVTDPQLINAILSLYFEWESKRTSHITFARRTTTAMNCTMDYDRDEGKPTEIRIFLNDFQGPVNVVPGSRVQVKMSVFRVSYEFSATVEAVADNPEKERWHVIIDVPTEIKSARRRRLPRISVNEESRQFLPEATWSDFEQKDAPVPIEILDLTLFSMRATGGSIGLKKGIVQLGKIAIPAEVVRSDKNETVLIFKFEKAELFGAFFDYYRKLAYPTLRERYEVPLNVGVDLYEKTKYFANFQADKSAQEKEEILSTWEALKSGVHITNSDYYVTNGDGEVTGCSGLALSYYSGEEPVWTFHQLCAVKDPQALRQSGVLYTWRAEYLAARPEKLSVAASFTSKSRWLERIYTKHSMNSKYGTKLNAVINRRCNISKQTKIGGPKFRIYEMGTVKRVSTTSTDLWGCVNPKFLNANENLNTVITLSDSFSPEDLLGLGGQLVEASGEDNTSIVFVTPPSVDTSRLGGVVQPSDRFCQIPKQDLIVFISSVEHSISVTERKLCGQLVE